MFNGAPSLVALTFGKQRVVLSAPRPEEAPFEPTPSYDFVKGLVDQHREGTVASAPQLRALVEHAGRLGAPELKVLEDSLVDRGEPVKLKVSQGRRDKTVKLSRDPARFFPKYVGGELGDLHGVETALGRLDQRIWANRGGDNESNRVLRGQLQDLRMAYALGPEKAPRVRTAAKDLPDVRRMRELVEKRNAHAELLSVDEGLEGASLMQDGFTRRTAAQLMEQSDGGRLRAWTAADAGKTLDAFYPRERSQAALTELAELRRRAVSKSGAEPLARLEEESAKHEEMLAAHDVADALGKQGTRVIVGQGPAVNLLIFGGAQSAVGVGRSKDAATGITEWRPTAEVKGNIQVASGGLVYYPGSSGVSRGLGAGVNVIEDPVVGTGVQIPLIPAMASLTVSSRGMIQADVTTPIPLLHAAHLTIPFTHFDLPLIFPIVGLHTKVTVQDPRLAPVAEKIDAGREWVGRTVSRMRRGSRGGSLPAEFRTPEADRPRRIVAVMGGQAFYSR